MMIKPILLAGFMALSTAASADTYWISQYRAAPGKFPALLELVTSTNWNAFEDGPPIVMRHSQGNHWDLMLLGKHADCNTNTCLQAAKDFENAANQLVDSDLSFQAMSDTDWSTLKAKDEVSGFYHIEMFNAGAGKHEALMRQRIIENDYIRRIGQSPNDIFEVTFGSDFDIFTIGFYESLQTYATPADVTPEEAEAAAIAAGFKNRADVSFLLRELIVGHHDTLAVKVPVAEKAP